VSPEFLAGLKVAIKYLALIDAIIATIFFYKYKVGKGKYFLFAIWFIVITEFSFRIVYYHIIDEKYPVYFISNLHYLIIGSFYLLWYRSLITNVLKKKAILVMLLTYLLFFTVNSIFFESFFEIQNYSYPVLTIFIVSAIFMYFTEVLKTEKILKFERSVFFWFSIGILIFWIPYLPLWFTSMYFGFSGTTYTLSIFTLNLLMHLFFIIGVLWSKKKYNY
jgi:hypothetical protein